MWRRTSRSPFRLRSADGQVFVVYEDVEVIDVGSFDEPDATLEGLKRLRTANGDHVNQRSETEFEILGVGTLGDSVGATRI